MFITICSIYKVLSEIIAVSKKRKSCSRLQNITTIKHLNDKIIQIIKINIQHLTVKPVLHFFFFFANVANWQMLLLRNSTFFQKLLPFWIKFLNMTMHEKKKIVVLQQQLLIIQDVILLSENEKCCSMTNFFNTHYCK